MVSINVITMFRGPTGDRSVIMSQVRSRQPALSRQSQPPQTRRIRSGASMAPSRLQRWARRNGVSCYRLYDADLPEYAVAVDLYESDEPWAVVQEYEAPLEVEPQLARRRLGRPWEPWPRWRGSRPVASS